MKECKTVSDFLFCAHIQPIEVCARNVLCGFRAHSSIPKSEASMI